MAFIIEPGHSISYRIPCAPREDQDQPAHAQANLNTCNFVGNAVWKWWTFADNISQDRDKLAMSLAIDKNQNN